MNKEKVVFIDNGVLTCHQVDTFDSFVGKQMHPDTITLNGINQTSKIKYYMIFYMRNLNYKEKNKDYKRQGYKFCSNEKKIKRWRQKEKRQRGIPKRSHRCPRQKQSSQCYLRDSAPIRVLSQQKRKNKKSGIGK